MIEGITLGEIVTAFAVVMAIFKGIDWVTDPLRKSKKEIDDLKKKAEQNEKEMKDIHEFMYASLIAVKALLKHGIDGNDVESMKDASRQIDTYLNRKVKEG